MRYWLFYFMMSGVMACEEMLNVGADLNWPPYSYLREQEPLGIDIDIARQVFKSVGFCIFFIDMPSAVRAQEQLYSGDLDVLMAASYSDDRAEKAWFSAPYRNESVVLFTHKNSAVSAFGVEDAFAKGATFAVNAGSYIGEKFITLSQAYPEQIVYLPSSQQRLLMLNSGRIDFVVEDKYAAKHISHVNGFKDVLPTEMVVYQNPIHFMLSRQRFTQPQVKRISHIISQK